MSTTTPTPRIHRPASPARFLAAASEILTVVILGTGLVLWLLERLPGWPPPGLPVWAGIAVMGVAMTLPVAAWLPLRRYPGRPTAELAGSFVAATLIGILLVATGLAPVGTALLVQHVLMLAGLLATLTGRWRALAGRWAR